MSFFEIDDDDNDLAAMMNEAYKGEVNEDSDGDDSYLFMETTIEPEPSVPQPQPVPTVEEEQISPTFAPVTLAETVSEDSSSGYYAVSGFDDNDKVEVSFDAPVIFDETDNSSDGLIILEDNGQEIVESGSDNFDNIMQNFSVPNNDIDTYDYDPNTPIAQDYVAAQDDYVNEESFVIEPDYSTNVETQEGYTPYKETSVVETSNVTNTFSGDLTELASKVIKVLDAYRSLDEKEQAITRDFIFSGSYEQASEAEIVSSVLNSDGTLGVTMSNLKRAATETDRVKRAFLILRLEGIELANLAELSATLNDKDLSELSNDHITLAQQVEEMIETLDSNIIAHVSKTESVLNAAAN